MDKKNLKKDPNYYPYKEFILDLLKKTILSLEEKQNSIINKGYHYSNRNYILIIADLNNEILNIINHYDESCSLENQLKYEKIITSIRSKLDNI